MKHGFYFFLICVIIAIFSGLGRYTSSSYQYGDCLSLPANEHVFKVVEVGKYGIKAIEPHYDGFEDVYLTQQDLKNAKPMDCFDLFKQDKQG